MHTAVQSATLATIGYDSARGILQLEFGNRVFYRYFGVPGPVYDALWAAPSKGRYFNPVIRGRFSAFAGHGHRIRLAG